MPFIFLFWLGLLTTTFPLIHLRDQSPITASVTVVAQPWITPSAIECEGVFVAHPLDHTTTTKDNVIRMFQANGAGLSVGDLDNDHDLDLVLGNLDFPDTVLWNEGNLQFRKTPLSPAVSRPNTRSITLVDVDADGWLDVVLTRGDGTLTYWHNQQAQTDTTTPFVRQTLPGVNRLAYVINWGDLDQDGDLDLVTATYDAGLLIERGNEYLFSSQGGVTYYENRFNLQSLTPFFRPTTLAADSMGLALALFDINQDHQPDIMVGNDFEVPDQVWLRTATGWQATSPFVNTTYSTMSLDAGDVENDGYAELFASDMKPYTDTAAMQAAYAPIMEGMGMEEMSMEGMEHMDAMHEMMQMEGGDPQVMENVLQVQDFTGKYYNHAMQRGIDGTGWSWSGKFGDLDNDGFLDLYVVNGMIEETMWAHLPNHELVEENQAFHNDQDGSFTSMPQWKLNASDSGRSMSMADFDQDGDLDIVVNNLRAPAQLFENRLCVGSSLQVELRWEGVHNRNAIGAELTLYTDQGRLQRSVRASSGYLSGDANRIHFGFSAGTTLQRLEIRWPDGVVSQIEPPKTASFLQITRS